MGNRTASWAEGAQLPTAPPRGGSWLSAAAAHAHLRRDKGFPMLGPQWQVEAWHLPPPPQRGAMILTSHPRFLLRATES